MILLTLSSWWPARPTCLCHPPWRCRGSTGREGELRQGIIRSKGRQQNIGAAPDQERPRKGRHPFKLLCAQWRPARRPPSFNNLRVLRPACVERPRSTQCSGRRELECGRSHACAGNPCREEWPRKSKLSLNRAKGKRCLAAALTRAEVARAGGIPVSLRESTFASCPVHWTRERGHAPSRPRAPGRSRRC